MDQNKQMVVIAVGLMLALVLVAVTVIPMENLVFALKNKGGCNKHKRPSCGTILVPPPPHS
ncbi:MAG: hypothetical protein WAK17_26205 [Candidatus Nitrosopolaris sp.]|jgi:hypothetical protein